MQELARAQTTLAVLEQAFPKVDLAIWRALLQSTNSVAADGALTTLLQAPTTDQGLQLALELQRRMIVLHHCERNRMPNRASAARASAKAIAQAPKLPAISIYLSCLASHS